MANDEGKKETGMNERQSSAVEPFDDELSLQPILQSL
jgi:hypothetical protein